jgi:hypothetical protein
MNVMSKVDFVVSTDPKDVPVPSSIPLFRYNRAYNIDAETYERVVL